MKNAPLLYHQFVSLEETFRHREIPLQEMGRYYDSFVPSQKYDNFRVTYKIKLNKYGLFRVDAFFVRTTYK